MTARDDFQILKTAVAIADGQIDTIAYTAAFERLFTPRPLMELVAEGWTRFWIQAGPEWHEWTSDLLDDSLFDHSNDIAIPILHPDDMGVGV